MGETKMKYNAAMGMVALVAGISFNTPAQAELCEYEAYSMQGIMEYINSDLQRQGFSYAPGLNVLEFQCNGSTILSESAAYGCLESLEDRYSGSKAARFQDAYGKVVGSL
jgi:hypothetical protein